MPSWHDFCSIYFHKNRVTLPRFLWSLLAQSVNRVRLTRFLLSVQTVINRASLTRFIYRHQIRTFSTIKLKQDISVYNYYFYFIYVKKPTNILLYKNKYCSSHLSFSRPNKNKNKEWKKKWVHTAWRRGSMSKARKEEKFMGFQFPGNSCEIILIMVYLYNYLFI